MSIIWSQHGISGTPRTRLESKAAERGQDEGTAPELSLGKALLLCGAVLVWWVLLALSYKLFTL